jgi:CRISPR-associated protein (TIGR02584 family)
VGNANGLLPSKPQPRTILFAATGMTPAILTETVWALAKAEEPVIPDQVVVVTTVGGNEVMQRELCTALPSGGLCIWEELRNAILGPSANTDERLNLCKARIVEAFNSRTGLGSYLEDLRTPGENAAAANFLLSELRRFTELPDTRLVVSIAGGRKTMGALLYACVSLVGRESDRLTHVLVNEPFDDPRLTPRFYFPKQAMQQLKTADGRIHKAANGKIDLADIPFVPFRNLFERDLINKPRTFVELVESCRHKVEEIARENTRLVIWRSKLMISVNGMTVPTSVREHLLLSFLAERAQAGESALPSYAAAFHDFNEFCKRTYAAPQSDNYGDWRHDANQTVTSNEMERLCIRVKNQLQEKLRHAGPEAARLLQLLPKAKRFSLDLPATAISLED